MTLAVQLRPSTDPEIPYTCRCHLLRHEDTGMMGRFVVVEPSTEAAVSRTIAAHAR